MHRLPGCVGRRSDEHQPDHLRARRERVARRDWNSPSIFAWLLANESHVTAEYLRKSYDYKNALFFVQKVLKADPANADAKKLQDKIKAAIDLENSAK